MPAANAFHRDASLVVPSSEAVFDAMHMAIVKLELCPGDVISRKDMARRLGVSLTPIRDALRRLEGRGLVETRAQASTTVSLIDRRGVFESHFLRVAANVEVARKLARLPGRELAVDAARSVFGASADTESDAFFGVLYDGLGMGGLCDTLSDRFDQLRQCRNIVGRDHNDPRPTFWYQILQRISAGDAKGAEQAVRACLYEDLALLGKATRLRPDYFR